MIDSAGDKATPREPSPWISRLAFCSLTLLLWISTVRWCKCINFAEDNERSWRLVLHEAYSRSWQWGQDIMFTYGPLGCFLTDYWYPETWRQMLVWIFGFQTLCMGLISQVILEMRSRLARVCLVLLFACMAQFSLLFGPDAFAMVILWLITCGYVVSGSRSLLRPLLIAFVAVIFSLAKFTLLVWSSVVFFAVLSQLWRIRGWRAALGLAGGSAVMLLTAWLACGQALSNVKEYLVSSWEISRGYAIAMIAAGPHSDLIHAAVSGGGLLLLLAISVGCRRNKIAALFAAGISLLTLLLLWKHGFVRQDLHSAIYFLVIPCLAMTCYLGPEGASTNRFWRSVLALLAIGVVLTSLTPGLDAIKSWNANYQIKNFPRMWFNRVVSNTRILFGLRTYLSEQESTWRQIHDREKIPELLQRVGEEPVAWFMDSQTVPIFGGIRLAPRKVIQSYSAYTPWLSRENARPFQDATAPRFAVVNIQPIDNRWPLGEDSLALLQVFSNYRPMANYGGYLLFERNPSVVTVEPAQTDLVDQRCRFGESVEVPRGTRNWKVFAIELPFSRDGKLLTALYKAPEVRLQLDCWDGHTHDFRLIPGQCECWSLLYPLIVENQALPTLFVGDKHREVRRIRVAVAENVRGQFDEPLRIRVREYPAPPKIPDDRFDTLVCPALFANPIEVNSPLHGTRLRHGKSVYTLAAPGTAKLVLPKDCREVRGFIGVNREENHPAVRENGIRFTITHVDPSGSEKVLFEQQHNPWKQSESPDEQEFKISLEGHSSGWLKLSTDCGKTLTGCSYWRDVRPK